MGEKKAAVFVLSVKQHKTVLGKEIPIDHISKSLMSSPVGINSYLYIILILKCCANLRINRNTSVFFHSIFRLLCWLLYDT